MVFVSREGESKKKREWTYNISVWWFPLFHCVCAIRFRWLIIGWWTGSCKCKSSFTWSGHEIVVINVQKHLTNSVNGFYTSAQKERTRTKRNSRTEQGKNESVSYLNHLVCVCLFVCGFGGAECERVSEWECMEKVRKCNQILSVPFKVLWHNVENEKKKSHQMLFQIIAAFKTWESMLLVSIFVGAVVVAFVICNFFLFCFSCAYAQWTSFVVYLNLCSIFQVCILLFVCDVYVCVCVLFFVLLVNFR